MNREDSYANLHQAFRQHIDSFLQDNELPTSAEQFIRQFEVDVEEILYDFVCETDWDAIIKKKSD